MNEEQTPADRGKIKQVISNAFGKAAPYYDEHAGLREDIAHRLIASLEPWQAIIPPGPVIELGCGTGFVTRGLTDLYPDRRIEITDLSPEMVACCKKQVSGDGTHSFRVQDAEQVSHDEPYYALVVSSFLVHWLSDPAFTMGQWLEAVKPGGLLLVAFPGNESFPGWRKHCRELGLPFTANPMPDVEEMVVKMSLGPSQVDYYEDTVTQTFDSSRDFFTHLKKIGASTRKEGRSLRPGELTMLINHWDSSAGGPVTVRYHVVFLAVKRDF